MTFANIFTGFAESRPWECRVFSFKIARASQKSRVFPFTFAPGCRQSLVFCVVFACFAHLCAILCLCAAVVGLSEGVSDFLLGLFPVKGVGPGFSLSGRPSALTAP